MRCDVMQIGVNAVLWLVCSCCRDATVIRKQNKRLEAKRGRQKKKGEAFGDNCASKDGRQGR